jgi:hypothetical protein
MKNASILFFLLFAMLSTCASAESGIVGLNETVSGLTQDQYVNMWWQWAVSMSDSESPVKDRKGIKCGVNQAGPVWFLAGGYGTSKIRRKCSIPADKYVFFPVINMLYFPRPERASLSCDQVKKAASLNNQYLVAFKVKIDKREYVNPAFYRHSSKKCFDLIARKQGVTEVQQMYPSATDGYWFMLRPLSVGKHEISFRAEYNRPGGGYGRMVQDIEYEINIYEP